MTRQQLDESRAVRVALDDAVEHADPALRQHRLPRVLHDSPAAVLLVEAGSGCVVQANAAGRALAPSLEQLPAPVSAWSAAAELRRPDGRAVPARRGPGRARSPRPGRATASRCCAAPRRATRSSGSPASPSPARTGPPTGRRWWSSSTSTPAATSSPRCATGRSSRPGSPSRSATRAGRTTRWSSSTRPSSGRPATTGRRCSGRNCRFLQGPDTDPADVQRIREALAGEQHRSVTLLNYRKDGTAFWNELSLSPVYDANGTLTHFVGIQADVTSRVLVEQERERHLAAERAARTEAERAQRRLALLAEATSMLAATLDVDESLDRLTSLVVPLMADWCTVHLLGPDGGVQRVAARHRDAEKLDLLRRLEELQPAGLGRGSITSSVLAGGPPALVEVDEDVLAAGIDDPELLEVYRQVGLRSAMVVPLRARRQVLGVLSLFTDGSGRTFDDDDLAMAADLARRAALTVDNARLYSREHDVAEQLQRSLLPQLQAGARARPRRALPARLDRGAGRRRLVRPVRPAGRRRRHRGRRRHGPRHDRRRRDGPAALGAAELRLAGQRPGGRARPARPARAGPGHGPARHLPLRPARAVGRGRGRAASGSRTPATCRRRCAAPTARCACSAPRPRCSSAPRSAPRATRSRRCSSPARCWSSTPTGWSSTAAAPSTTAWPRWPRRCAPRRTATPTPICEHLLAELAYGDLDDDVALLVVRVLE